MMPLVVLIDIQRVVPENIHTPPLKGWEIPGGRGWGFSKAQKCK